MQIVEKMSFARSPFFYVGDKYKLLPQIYPLFPLKVGRIIEPFVGGGSVFLNTEAREVLANDLDSNVIAIHNLLFSQGEKMNLFVVDLIKLARSHELSCSFEGDQIAPDIRKQYPKTYFAYLNRQGFSRLKEKYNNSSNRDVVELYALMIYGFNRMLRFNKQGRFNIPVGNVDFNPNVVKALLGYSESTKLRKIKFSNMDFELFLKGIVFKAGDFVYVDPPYLITASEYNKGWDELCERRLYELLDVLDTKGVKFAVSNVVNYGNRANGILKNWMNKYLVSVVSSNYINYFDNGKKRLSEVFVCNYE